MNDWWDEAAALVLTELKGRRGIGQAFDEIDDDIKQEIYETIAEIIKKAYRP